jgi:hypothetical protein
VLSPTECEYYIKVSEELGLVPLGETYRTDYRNNDRVVANSQEVSDLIWKRVQPFITDIEITKENNHRVGVGYGLEGLWKPNGLNYCWRLCRYLPGGHFGIETTLFVKNYSSSL